MQQRTVRTFLFSSALLALTLPGAAWAEDGAELPKLQITMRDGKTFVTNPAPNAPVVISKASPVTAAMPFQLLDDRMPVAIQSLVHSISKTHGMDPQLVAAVMKAESNYDRWARSPKGALGLMQLIPETGQRFGVRDFFDPAQNIEGGVRYLRFLSDKFGPSKIDLILAAYNAGENLVERLGRVPAIPETRDYVRKIGTMYKPSNGPILMAAAEAAKTVVETAAPEPEPAKIYKSVDERGVVHFSNGPPR
jgi:hypothetical protein